MLLEVFFEVIGKPIDISVYKKPQDQIALLFRELKAGPYFLFFDNFEVLIDPKTSKPLKPGFSDLIEKAKKIKGASRIMFTCWECPASERGIRPKRYQIGGLDRQAAIKLLRSKGLTEPDNELEKSIELSGGHPLALILLTQLLEEGVKTLSDLLSDNSLWIGKKGEVARNILDKVYTERLDEEEQKFLQYVSVYRKPVTIAGIITVADKDWEIEDAENLALSLTRKSLLNQAEESYWMESLIQNYAYKKLPDKVDPHKLACKFYLSLPRPENPRKKEDLKSLIEAHYQACKAKEYDKAYGIVFDNNLHLDLDRWGDYRTLVELYDSLLPKDYLKDKSLLSKKNYHSTLIGSLGNAYRDLGEVRKAIEYYDEALRIAKEIEDKQGEGACLGNLGIAYHILGEVRKAIEYYDEALRIAKEIGDKRSEELWLKNLRKLKNI